ncbi:MAG: response regulator [Proteobacteria bacterium]|nr:response regulator [Pseudomonadota bacterium]
MSPPAGLALTALQLELISRRVLLAEDDEDLRLLLAAALKSHGYRVDEVADGAALLERLASSQSSPYCDDPIELLISDLHIPCLSGLDVLASLRGTENRLPVILITADDSPRLEGVARRLGAAAYFRKPFDVCDLLTAVVNVSVPALPAT